VNKHRNTLGKRRLSSSVSRILDYLLTHVPRVHIRRGPEFEHKHQTPCWVLEQPHASTLHLGTFPRMRSAGGGGAQRKSVREP
jgi:hypothetical protein